MGIVQIPSLTRLTCLLIFFYVVATIFSQQQWKEENGVIKGDVRGYYAYLPATFIHHDLKFENPEVYKTQNESQAWYSEDKNGHRFIKYTYGMSVLYSPFFFAAHLYAKLSDNIADGYSEPYRFSLTISAIVFFCLGLIFLSKFLRLFFEDHVVATTLLLIYGTTNLLNYSTFEMTYSHGYSFALLSLFLFSTAQWLNDQKLKWAFWIGVSFGFLVLIRPVDLIFGLFPLLFKVGSTQDLKQRFRLLIENHKHLILVVILFSMIMLPQVLYAYYSTGKWLFYSYSGESFFFLKPHLIDSLFNYRNGWLIYSPFMMFSLIGILITISLKRKLGVSVLIIFILYHYVISSWWCWWYVGFGNRAFINLYPILAIALAFLIQLINKRSFITKFAFRALLLGAVFLNVFQTAQFKNGIIHWGAMTKDAYWSVFLKTKPSQLLGTYLNMPDADEALNGRNVVQLQKIKTVDQYNWSFENLNDYSPDERGKIINDGKAKQGKKQFLINEEDEFSLGRNINVKNASAVYCSIWAKGETDNLMLTMTDNPFQECYFSASEVVHKQGEWKKLHLYADMSCNKSNDSLFFYLWNTGRQELLVDDLRIEVLDINYVNQEIK